MRTQNDPVEVVVLEETSDEFATLTSKPVGRAQVAPITVPGAATTRLHGFDLEDRPLVAGTPGLPHEILPARWTVPLRCSDIGAQVVLLFEGGDPRQPIIVGVVQEPRPDGSSRTSTVSVQADDERFVVTAEREIVLKCGEASITLTRSGKVLIKGTYVSTRSSGVNRIKGGSVEIN